MVQTRMNTMIEKINHSSQIIISIIVQTIILNYDFFD